MGPRYSGGTSSWRQHELGIRTALGADRRHLLELVVGKGLALTAVGSAIGLGLALVLTRFLSSLLFGVEALDVGSFLATSFILLVVGALACWGPARRALATDPANVLR